MATGPRGTELSPDLSEVIEPVRVFHLAVDRFHQLRVNVLVVVHCGKRLTDTLANVKPLLSHFESQGSNEPGPTPANVSPKFAPRHSTVFLDVETTGDTVDIVDPYQAIFGMNLGPLESLVNVPNVKEFRFVHGEDILNYSVANVKPQLHS